MNYEVSLSLELLEQGGWGLRFGLTVRNHSTAKLFLPFPEIHGLRFRNTATMLESEWYTCLLVSAAGRGFCLGSGESRPIKWQVRPCDIARPETPDHSDYYRWCVELPPGEYGVWFRWQVTSEYFDPDSHMRFPDLEYLAKKEGAAVWLGHALSNELRVHRIEKGDIVNN